MAKNTIVTMGDHCDQLIIKNLELDVMTQQVKFLEKN